MNRATRALSVAAFVCFALAACHPAAIEPITYPNGSFPTATPSASPTPIATATPVPTPGAIVVSPASLSFLNVGASYAMTVNVTQTNYSGPFAATTAASGATSCNGIAAIAPSAATSFTVTPLAAGSCSFTISGGGAVNASLAVVVTTTSIGGS